MREEERVQEVAVSFQAGRVGKQTFVEAWATASKPSQLVRVRTDNRRARVCPTNAQTERSGTPFESLASTLLACGLFRHLVSRPTGLPACDVAGAPCTGRPSSRRGQRTGWAGGTCITTSRWHGAVHVKNSS